MCGIVGYTGINQVAQPILKGLKKLEYRGYDSSGIYINNGSSDILVKATGGVDDLRDVIEKQKKDLTGTAGIAHTRWATHGGVNVDNAHPHMSEDGRFYLVHNGVIENFQELKEQYLQDVNFHSETDSEVAVQLIDKFVKDGFSTFDSIRMMISKLDGESAYSFLIMDRKEPDLIFVAKNKSPMLVGLSDEGNVVASDAIGVLDITHDFIELHDGEIAVVDKNKVDLFDKNGKQIQRESFHVDIDASDTDKGIYPYYMLKEIDEQAIVARNLSEYYFDNNDQIQNIDPNIIKAMNDADRFYIIAAGTSWHAGLVGKRFFEQWANKPVEVFISSEFAFDQPKLSEKPFFIFLTQSGETADSREALIKIKEQGYPTLTLSNVMNSTLTREADFALPLMAGPEIAVASTKAYTAQIIAQSILAHAIGNSKMNIREELANIAVYMQSIIDSKEIFQKIANDALKNQRSAFYIGRGLDADVSYEAALKLKEISYIQTEGFAAGELKHGTISLIENKTPVFAFITQSKTAGLVRGNISETAARGAKTIIISSEKNAKSGDAYVLPQIPEIFMALLSVIPAQLIAYYATIDRGLNVDRPRNLAKSVTVQ
ncbi:MAG: glutamine--fructose-6-phosphate transaminase (isomerizing) [Lactobacillaceae bacterium]|jgi:glucosamine--fructose-6-phosphate aminotransferase (isomerizing)|nr:glutamine--fructose-6-phosphate transaminase (isomerizing) [Lactobacillaceae bacterium]